MRTQVLSAAIALLGLATVAEAAPVVVDGNLSEWGVAAAIGSSDTALGPNTKGNTTPISTTFGTTSYAGVPDRNVANGGFIFAGRIEDTNDLSNSYNPGPVSGGQAFDAEALLIGRHAGMYYVAIMSGQLPGNGNQYEPGDLGIEIQRGSSYSYYGIELGGVAGTGISTTNPGSTDTGTHYNLDGSGNVSNVTKKGVAGGIYATSLNGAAGNATGWTPGVAQSEGNPNGIFPINGTGGVEAQLNLTTLGGASVGQATIARQYMTNLAGTFGHEMLELSFDGSGLFQSGDIVRFWWATGCGNDVLVTPTFQNLTLVPEPATLALAGLGVASLAVQRRSRRQA